MLHPNPGVVAAAVDGDHRPGAQVPALLGLALHAIADLDGEGPLLLLEEREQSARAASGLLFRLDVAEPDRLLLRELVEDPGADGREHAEHQVDEQEHIDLGHVDLLGLQLIVEITFDELLYFYHINAYLSSID